MFESLKKLRRTFQSATAASDSFAFGTGGIIATYRASIRKDECGLVTAARLFNHPDNLWNNIAGTLDYHLVANADIFSPDFILIMQGGVGYNDATNRYRLQPRNRRQRTGASNLNINGADRGFGLFRRKFMRQRPAWCARHLTEAGLIVMPVNFIHHAVNVIGKAGARPTNGVIALQQPVNIRAFAGQIIHGKPETAQSRQKFPMCCGDFGTCFTHRIGKKL